MAALHGIVTKMWPHRIFWNVALFPIVNGYVFHIGLALVVFAFAPHILFIKSPDRRVLARAAQRRHLRRGRGHGGIADRGCGASRGQPGAAPHLARRRLHKLDVTLAARAHRAAGVSHIGARYETLLAVHILSVCVFFIWFPFGKLMHAFLFIFSRAATGMRFRHRGAEL